MPSHVTPHRVGAGVLLLVVALSRADASAHDASAWGGLFRTRDAGATWLHVNPASFVSAALAVAVSPVDPHHLLLATDTGVSRSRNGGRDWVIEARDVLVGPGFAVTFDVDGQRALVAGASALFRGDGDRWSPLRLPAGSIPARALVSGSVAGRVYLAGWGGLHRSDDWGASWINVGDGIRAEYAASVVVPPSHPEHVYVLAGGRFWVSIDAGRSWQLRSDGLPASGIEVVAVDPSDANRLWSVATGQVFRTDDQGQRWRPIGASVPDKPVVARAVAVVDDVILMATDRGVHRSADGGQRWELSSDNLPAHVGAGLLVRDPLNPATVYAGFALTSHEELLRRAGEGGSPLGRLDLVDVAGGLAFLALLFIAAGLMVRRVARSHYRVPRAAPR